MAKHAVVRTDKMLGTQGFPQIASFKFFATVNSKEAPAEIENGNVVDISAGLLTDGADVPTIINREEYKAVAPTASTKLKDVLLVANPELDRTVKYNALDEYINKADMPVRGYHLHENDIFSVTDEALDGTAAVGKLVELQAGTKLKVVASATSGSTTIGKIIQIETVGSKKFNVIKVA